MIQRPTVSPTGFTLIEVLIVLAILGITAAAVAPAMVRGLSEDDVTRVARRLEMVLGSARTAALEGAATVEFALVLETGRYRVLDRDGVELDSGAIELDAGLRLHSPNPRPVFRFDRLGTGFGDEILVLSPAGARALVVDQWTGAIRVARR